jgi:hypothetical protein
VEEVVKLFSAAFEQVCALKEVQRLGIDSFVQTRPATFVETIGASGDGLSVEVGVALELGLLCRLCEAG